MDRKVTFIIQNGAIENNGTVVSDTAYYDRQSVQNYTLIPDKGNTNERVLYNNEDVTSQVDNGIFTAPPIITDSVLEIFYKKSELENSISQSVVSQSSDIKPVITGDSTNMYPLTMSLIFIVSALWIILIGKRKSG